MFVLTFDTGFRLGEDEDGITKHRHKGCVNFHGFISASFIGKIVSTVIVVWWKREALLPVQLPSSPLLTSQSLSGDLSETAPTHLNTHILGVWKPPKAKVNEASIAMFITSRYFSIFVAIVIKSLIGSRWRRKPQQSRRDNVWNVDFIIQSPQKLHFPCMEMVSSDADSWIFQDIYADSTNAFS